MDERETINQLSKKAGAGAGGRDSGDDECGFGGSQEPEWSPTRADGTTHSCIAREATPKCGAECDGVCASFRAREVVERAAHSSEVDAPMSYLNQPCAC